MFHPAKLLAGGKATDILAQSDKPPGTATCDGDALRALDCFGYTRLSDCDVTGNQAYGDAYNLREAFTTLVFVHEVLL